MPLTEATERPSKFQLVGAADAAAKQYSATASPTDMGPTSVLPKLHTRFIWRPVRLTGELIRSRQDVMGGDACIRNTRIPVWLLYSLRRQGAGDDEILADYPEIDSEDLDAAWAFARTHANVVGEQLLRHEFLEDD